MAKIQRANQKIFASDAGANQIGQFGSFAAGSVAYTTSPEVIQALAEYDEGWFSAVVANNSPCIEDVNALDYLFSYQLAYQFQSGIPEWDDATEYYIGSYATDGTGGFYISKADTNTNNALTNTTYWMPVVVTTPSTGGQVFGPTGSTNAGLTYRFYVPTAASTTPSAVITTPYLEFTSQSVNGAPGLLGNQNGATPDAGLFFIAATKDANTAGDMRFDVRENDNSAFATSTRIAFRWSTFGTTLMTVLRNGALAIGPDGVANQHTLNGEFIRKGTSGTATRILGGASDSTENYFYLSTAGAKFRLPDNSANAGAITIGGNWGWGIAVTGNSNGNQHLSNGYIYGGNVTSTNASGALGIGSNVRYPGANAAETGRTNTTTGGAGLRFQNRTANNVVAIGFYVNQISDSTSTNADEVMSITQEGVFQWGITNSNVSHSMYGDLFQFASGGNSNHRIRAFGTAGTDSSLISMQRSHNNSVGTDTIVQNGDVLGMIDFRGYDGSTYARGAYIRGVVNNTPGASDMPCRIDFATSADGSASPTIRFTIQDTGACNFGFTGPDANTGYFKNNSISNTVVVAENLSTNATSTAGTSCYLAIKGTNTDTNNVFFAALRNAGGAQNGTLVGSGSNTLAFGGPSDKRLKKNIRTLEGAFDKMMEMKPSFFTWKERFGVDDEGEKVLLQEEKDDVGFIADDVEKVFRDHVWKDKNGIKQLRGWNKEFAYVLGAFHEFVGMVKSENKELKETIASLIERLANLESRLSPA